MTIGDFQKDVLLAEHINFRLGGTAKYFFVAKTKEEIIEAIKLAKKKNIPFYILGGGANVLAADEGYDGLVLKIQTTNYKLLTTGVWAEAGCLLGDVVEAAANASLSGLEWAAG
ncbi:MAG: FAD-binding protein, partial [bacterium]|nr:FAD-binding protein [bacterium]